MAPAGRRGQTARGAMCQQRRGCLRAPSPARPGPAPPRLIYRTDLDQRAPLRVRSLTGERLPVLLASSPRVPPPAAPSGRGCTSGPRLEGGSGSAEEGAEGGGACASGPSRRLAFRCLSQTLPVYLNMSSTFMSLIQSELAPTLQHVFLSSLYGGEGEVKRLV